MPREENISSEGQRAEKSDSSLLSFAPFSQSITPKRERILRIGKVTNMNQTSKTTVVTGSKSHVSVLIPKRGETSQVARVVTTAEREVKRKDPQTQTPVPERGDVRNTQVDPTILTKMRGRIIIPASSQEHKSASEISTCSQKTTDV